MMTDDEAIDKMLTGLGAAEIPVGLEERVLRSLEVGAVTCQTSPWSWLKVAGVGLAGLAVAALVVVEVQRRDGDTVRLVTGASPAAEVAKTDRAVVEAGVLTTAPAMGRANAKPRSRKISGESDLAISEMRAESFPAPPMPLTEQERLLVQMVHQGDPKELAMLEPERRAARDAEEKAAVQRFFGVQASGDEKE